MQKQSLISLLAKVRVLSVMPSAEDIMPLYFFRKDGPITADTAFVLVQTVVQFEHLKKDDKSSGLYKPINLAA